jgi:hypothetical protein
MCGLCADSALACSFVNEAAARANSVVESGYYWIGSGVLGVVVACVELHQRRWSIILALSIGLLVFHPKWTVAPIHGPDCVFLNVEASQFVLAVICLLLGYQVFRIVRARRSRTA